MEPAAKPGASTHLNVGARDADDAEVKVKVVHDETKKPIPNKVIDNGDNTYAVHVTPPAAGHDHHYFNHFKLSAEHHH